MDVKHHIFLTGATGLIGRYLLRNFLQDGHQVTVLIRPNKHQSVPERLNDLITFAQIPKKTSSQIQVIEGCLKDPALSSSDFKKIESFDMIVHSAASLSFHKNMNGEPWTTNLEGTRNLINVARKTGIKRWIQVSTAYVCGQQEEKVYEDDHNPASTQNDYEASKRAAEELITQQQDLDWTILRPGIVVGDSNNGYASTYQGIYHCLKSVAFMSRKIKPDNNGNKKLPIRYNLSGKEKTNLIPVDWVAEAITQLSLNPETINQYFHLTSQSPLLAETLVDAVQDYYELTGIAFIGKDAPQPEDKNIYEKIFDRETKRLGPYFQDDPDFDRSNLNKFLPGLEDFSVDKAFIHKLLNFAESDKWGKAENKTDKRKSGVDCNEFFEIYFPEAASQSKIARIKNLNISIGFRVHGNQGGGSWICIIKEGDVVSVNEISILPDSLDVYYSTSHEIFDEIVTGAITTRDAFFKQHLQIDGDIEKALLLSVLLEDLLQEIPFKPTNQIRENICA